MDAPGSLDSRHEPDARLELFANHELDVRGLVQCGADAGDTTPYRVHRNIYIDPAVFEAELERIFARTWVYVGHESEVPKPGDFTTTTIGRQPVILTRRDDGQLTVLLNRCTHRASTICQERRGST